MAKVDNKYIIKVLVEKIEKISGKKVILEEKEVLQEALDSPEKVESLLKRYIRINKLQGVFRITKHSNYIVLNYIQNKPINEESLRVFLLNKEFTKYSSKRIKDKDYLQFKNKTNNIIILVETTSK